MIVEKSAARETESRAADSRVLSRENDAPRELQVSIDGAALGSRQEGRSHIQRCFRVIGKWLANFAEESRWNRVVGSTVGVAGYQAHTPAGLVTALWLGAPDAPGRFYFERSAHPAPALMSALGGVLNCAITC